MSKNDNKIDVSIQITDSQETIQKKLSKAARNLKIEASLGENSKEKSSMLSKWLNMTKIIKVAETAVKSMANQVIKLNTAETDLAMAANITKPQMTALISSYSKLGDELKATVTDISQLGTEWLKHGKTVAETTALIKDSMVLSKIGNLSSAESTKYLASIMDGYKISAEGAMNIVDKLSSVDVASGANIGGLAAGISEVAKNADSAGISLDKLLGYFAAVGDSSQAEMTNLSGSINAALSRMENIRLSKLDDYENNGESLSGIEAVLGKEGISLRDSSDSFRDLGEVLDEVASKWDSYSEVSQNAVAGAFAGSEHSDNFAILMENYDNAMKYAEISLDSSGQAMEKFSVYQESLTGKTEEFKNAFIGLSTTVLDSDFLKGIIESGTSLINIFDAIIGKLGVIPTLSAGIGAALSIKNVGGARMFALKI